MSDMTPEELAHRVVMAKNAVAVGMGTRTGTCPAPLLTEATTDAERNFIIERMKALLA